MLVKVLIVPADIDVVVDEAAARAGKTNVDVVAVAYDFGDSDVEFGIVRRKASRSRAFNASICAGSRTGTIF